MIASKEVCTTRIFIIGKVKSLSDESIYKIDSRELLRTKIELPRGNKVLFDPFEDPDGNNYARIISIIELNI